ncbi:hypothetical protein [Shimia sagamensis]|uniref:Integral membrane protein n=1 Tax=Shimia sagamensis TaxID=1566352 RepID=A0ABY1NIY1_9RHOB|nr:hypothetical protein [Shimia sagamensis]SMP10875.1 hypothetical protein SAMN06265373_102193 [Shimia sagamensis]
MKANAPIFYILSQIGVFCIVYTLLLATHTSSIAVDFCAPDYASRTAVFAAKVAIFSALIHAPGLVVAHRFADTPWGLAALPMLCALGFVAIYYGNDVFLRAASGGSCTEEIIPRSIFRPEWHHSFLQLCTRILAYGWGIASLLVLYKTSRMPIDIYED